jgi:hypothetical protein
MLSRPVAVLRPPGVDMSDDAWVRMPLSAEVIPWICTKCGGTVTEGPPMHELDGLKPREAHAVARPPGPRGVVVSVTPQEEPSAAARELARAVRDWFVALVQAGFTEAQAERICGQIIAAGMAAGGQS